jgi:hypothetical protein
MSTTPATSPAIPSGCGIGKDGHGNIVLHGEASALAEWWLREMKGREINGKTVAGLALRGSTTDDGVWWDDTNGSTGLRTWDQVHADIGGSFLRAAGIDPVYDIRPRFAEQDAAIMAIRQSLPEQFVAIEAEKRAAGMHPGPDLRDHLKAEDDAA